MQCTVAAVVRLIPLIFASFYVPLFWMFRALECAPWLLSFLNVEHLAPFCDAWCCVAEPRKPKCKAVAEYVEGRLDKVCLTCHGSELRGVLKSEIYISCGRVFTSRSCLCCSSGTCIYVIRQTVVGVVWFEAESSQAFSRQDSWVQLQ